MTRPKRHGMNHRLALKTFALILAAACLLVAVAQALPSEEGLYATFATSQGSFVARLDYDKAPHTVANFIGLAQGTRPWVDFMRGNLSTHPFYDGIIFHRVISGFVIQAGSLNKQGTDDPGYSFGDEFHKELRHDTAGVLSMANAGSNSNGSQFFITLAPTSWLDNKHSVFGHIVEGMNIVEAISNQPTPEVYDPQFGYTTIQSVTITAIGSSATNFKNTPPAGLPLITGTSPTLQRQGGALQLTTPRPAFSKNFIFNSTNLTNWTSYMQQEDRVSSGSPFEITVAPENESREFYRVVRANYIPRPQALIGKTLTLNATSASQTLTITIAADEGYAEDGNFGSVVIDNGAPMLLRGYYLWPTLSTLYFDVGFGGAYTFALNFSDASHGWFTCQVYGTENQDVWPIFGTFQIQETP